MFVTSKTVTYAVIASENLGNLSANPETSAGPIKPTLKKCPPYKLHVNNAHSA